MSNQGVGDGVAGAGKDREHGGRQASLHQDIGGRQRGEGSELGRLDHDGIATGQGGRDLPGSDDEGEVPGGDEGAHADGLTQGNLKARVLYRDGLAEDLVCCSSPVLKYGGDKGNFTTSVAGRFARGAGLDGGDSL